MVFSSTRRKKRSTRIKVSADPSSDDPGRRVVLVDLISSGDWQQLRRRLRQRF
jgi:mRNA-degrading endonuclease toxin of MazEF toxin-antitoxin module